VGLIVLSPVLALIAVAILIVDGRPVVYRANRVGRCGTEFFLLKFRTMTPGADKTGAGLTTRDDARITGIGRLLRRYKLDEYPQLLNVLRGDMSFVGPRPEDPRFVARYTDEQRAILHYRPGITSPASLAFKDESSLLTNGQSETEYLDRILPEKLTMDMQYLLHRTWLSDVKLIFRTIGGVTR
jgi:lipopolysaccharide/colanic/teichoic acid biosynthesis glycosyltransferase